MIKLRTLITEILAERMSFSQLFRQSDPRRIDKSKRISTKSLVVTSNNNKEAWKFSYKSPGGETTTGQRHQGFIYFFKENVNPGENAMDIDCSVDCSCPDYRYRFAYNNASVGAGETGGATLNKNNGQPSTLNRKPGLCKHLLALNEYLHTEISPIPTPDKTQKPSTIITPNKEKTDQDPADVGAVDMHTQPSPNSPTDAAPEPEDNKVDMEPSDSNLNNDPTQAPDNPDQVNEPQDEPIDNNDEEDQDKNKLKETINKSLVFSKLDELCRNKKVFIVNYHD